MIPVQTAIKEQAWLLIDNSDYSNKDDYDADEIRKVKFRIRPLGLTKIDPAPIDNQDEITKVMISDSLWLLSMDLVVLSKEPVEDAPENVFHKYILIKDGDGFTFKAVYDYHLCCSSSSNFAKRNGLANFYRTELFNPKIKYKAAILFELPDEIDDLFFASAYSEIREA
ncbi:MAG: hypothetical protein IPG63_10145 [Xanthomonadales bacterium]|nr:hypothetical protein [Xanthomonadales bacterium]MBK7146000.1 hypothetical protein [Xanthomonadales bacterium]